MILWYAAGTVAFVWFVFQSGGLDFRIVAVGGLAPLVADAPVGHMAAAHALLAPVAVLAVIMVATAGRGRKLLRRRIIGLPIGWMCGLAFAGAFAHTDVFWWPTAGERAVVPLLPSWPWIIVRELVGIVVAAWCVVAFGLERPDRRARFVRTGRLEPDAERAEDAR